MLGIKEIEEIIPHRHPFLLIDYIEDYKPGEYAVGYKCVTFREDFFRGHFPQERRVERWQYLVRKGFRERLHSLVE